MHQNLEAPRTMASAAFINEYQGWQLHVVEPRVQPWYCCVAKGVATRLQHSDIHIVCVLLQRSKLVGLFPTFLPNKESPYVSNLLFVSCFHCRNDSIEKKKWRSGSASIINPGYGVWGYGVNIAGKRVSVSSNMEDGVSGHWSNADSG